jgi:hypothetical protein
MSMIAIFLIDFHKIFHSFCHQPFCFKFNYIDIIKVYYDYSMLFNQNVTSNVYS